MSDQGIGLISQTEIAFEKTVVAIFLEHEMDIPWYFLTEIKTCDEMIPGFYQYGLHISEFLNQRNRKKTRAFDATVIQLLSSTDPV